MDFFEAVERRRSTRAFTSESVEVEKLGAILTMARLAPSAGDLQAYQIVVIDSGTKNALAAAALGQDFVAQAAVVLVFCARVC